MAQREEEPSELRAPEAVTRLCANGCGIHGNPATKNMCQSCFQASCFGHEKPRSAPIRSPEVAAPSVAAPPAEAGPPPAAGRAARRCSGCRRKVGLMGFRCRCGEMFCGEHRYSDRHDCSFDYKAAGREAIERENPVVRAAKIVRV